MVHHHNSIKKLISSISETWWLCRLLYKVNLGINQMNIFSNNNLAIK